MLKHSLLALIIAGVSIANSDAATHLQETSSVAIEKKINRALPPQEKITIKRAPALRTDWSIKVANIVNQYFSQPYSETSIIQYPDIVCSGFSPVTRPNHSLAHGMRQAHLAVDIIRVFYNLKLYPNQTLTKRGTDLYQWVQKKVKEDPLFLQKIEFIAAFLRSGRLSEATQENETEKEQFKTYIVREANLFEHEARKVETMPGVRLFNDSEIDEYKKTLLGTILTPGSDGFYLSHILKAAHLLDLRRLPDCRINEVKAGVSQQLFGAQKKPDAKLTKEKQIIEWLWDRSGEYLEATGDRDVVKGRFSFNEPLFCMYAQYPETMINGLQRVRTKSEHDQVIDTIVKHTEVIKDIKNIPTKPSKQDSVFVIQHNKKKLKVLHSRKSNLKTLKTFESNLKIRPILQVKQS